MIRSRHTGINVYSLADSLKFYVDTLGMTLAECRTETGPYIDTLTGIDGTLQHWAKVSTDDGYLLELVQWVRPDPSCRCTHSGYDTDGINHLCFQVDSVDNVHETLTLGGYEARTIQTDPPGKVKNFSAFDPDGNIVEFVEVLEKSALTLEYAEEFAERVLEHAFRPDEPMQPIVKDCNGVERFRSNAIVRYLLDMGPFDMNHLGILTVSPEDRMQFAQLIGYSLDGYEELSYVTDESYEEATRHAP